MLEIIILIAIILGSLSVFCYFARRLDRQFHSMVEEEIQALESRAKESQDIQQAAVESLPGLVQSYLRRVLDIDRVFDDCVKVSQVGEFRLGDESSWFPLESVSHVLTSELGFIWKASLNPGSRFTIFARDKLVDGQGFMLMKPAYSRDMEDRTGPEITTSMLVRYLSEIPWFPSSIVNNRELEWIGEENNSVRVSTKVDDIRASGVFEFDEDGRIVKFSTTERFQETEEGFTRVPWTLRYSDYKEFDGVEVPSEIEAAWTIDKKSFPYLRLERISAR